MKKRVLGCCENAVDIKKEVAMSEIKHYWEIIDNFFMKNNLKIYDSLSGPADETEISSLETILDVKLPEAFRESLMIHDGQNDRDNFIMFADYQKLLSVSEMIAHYKMHRDLFENETIDYIRPDECKYIRRNYIYHNKWLQFTDSEGDGLILDFDPAVQGRAGQVFFRPHDDNPADQIIAETYRDWLKNICEKLENRQYTVRDGMLLFDNFTFQVR
jgi:cell wall assembly regulator SMI1